MLFSLLFVFSEAEFYSTIYFDIQTKGSDPVFKGGAMAVC